MENLGEGNVDEETGMAKDAGADGNEQRDGTPKGYSPVVWGIGIVALALHVGFLYAQRALEHLDVWILSCSR